VNVFYPSNSSACTYDRGVHDVLGMFHSVGHTCRSRDGDISSVVRDVLLSELDLAETANVGAPHVLSSEMAYKDTSAKNRCCLLFVYVNSVSLKHNHRMFGVGRDLCGSSSPRASRVQDNPCNNALDKDAVN